MNDRNSRRGWEGDHPISLSDQIVSIDAPECELSYVRGRLTCRSGEETSSFPIAEVAVVVVTSSSVLIRTRLLTEAARHGVGLVVCDPSTPPSVILSPSRCTSTVMTRAQVDLPSEVRERLWRMTVDAKVINQVSLARDLAPGHPSLPELELCEARRELSKKIAAAEIFWGIFDDAVVRPVTAQRGRRSGHLIDLLRHGNTLLLSVVLRACFSLGISPTFGMQPSIRAQTVPLAFDLLEPFRPCVHSRVAQWIIDHPELEAWDVSEAFRRYLAGCIDLGVRHAGVDLSVRECIRTVVQSFQAAVLGQDAGLYTPWIQGNSTWVRDR